ncbi:MAG: hypothetical protein ACE5HP_12815 [Gemmatimonadota bacterium]
MNIVRRIGVAALAGVIAGVLVAGIGGRVAMRIIALASGAQPGFSIGGTLAAMLGVAAVSMPFSLAYVLAGQHLTAGKWRAPLFGALYFPTLVGIALLRPSGLGELAIAPVLGIGLFTVILALHGIAVHALAVRLERTMPPVRKTVSSIVGYGLLTAVGGFGVFAVFGFIFGT